MPCLLFDETMVLHVRLKHMPSNLPPEKSFDIQTYWDIERVYTRTPAMQHWGKHFNPGLKKKSDTIGRNWT